MKINELIYKLRQIRNEHGDVEVFRWESSMMSNIDFNVCYNAIGDEINKENTVVII